MTKTSRPTSRRPPLPDEAARRAAVHERARNVLVDAGPGTGKTHLIVERVVEMVAPTNASVPPVPLARLAVLTFTRRAAGELRYRLRQRLLGALRTPGSGDTRMPLLREALGTVDTSYVGTIHSFADRLLRLRPVEADISPHYEIAEDDGPLLGDTFDRLVHAADAETLGDQLGERVAQVSVPIEEIEATIRLAQAAGLRMERRETLYGVDAGFDLIVECMIRTRDVDYVPPLPELDIEAIRAAAKSFAARLAGGPRETAGERWLLMVGSQLRELADTPEPAALFQLAHATLGRLPKYTKRDHFPDNEDGWTLYKLIGKKKAGKPQGKTKGKNEKRGKEAAKKPQREQSTPADGEWRASLLDPLYRWMGARLVRVREVAIALYAQVKEERGVLDQLDLLVRLRDLLRDDRGVRRHFQSLFDHLFIDEFQDTDPLQCEIVFFLAEDGTTASDWRGVRLRPGHVTIVGDPKQSIYRFRRADIGTYAEAHRLLQTQGALPVAITTSFRSRPGLVAFHNRQLGALLGGVADAPERRFDPETGRVAYERIDTWPEIPAAGTPVHVVAYEGPAGTPLTVKDGGRLLEAQALARYIRWLVERSGLTVRDPESQRDRPVRHGDIAVLAHVTTSLGALLDALASLGIQYTAHGGVLFLSNPLVRRYLLGLRAIADASDGVALAALLRPPFFALDLIDSASARLPDAGASDVAAARGRLASAHDLIRELRRDRRVRPAIETALDLIERTALGRSVAVGPNGPQSLQMLYEVAHRAGRLAVERGLDFDGVTRQMRKWVEDPIPMDPPDASGPDTVRVMTIHQAKGLEFPIVVLWDGFAEARGLTNATWCLAREGDGVALTLDAVRTELPHGRGLLDRDKALATAERERLFFVALTRARDLLVIPRPAAKSPGGHMVPRILHDADPALVTVHPPYRPDAPPEWARIGGDGDSREPVADVGVAATMAASVQALAAGLSLASAPIAVSVAVTEEARRTARDVPPQQKEAAGTERLEETSRAVRGPRPERTTAAETETGEAPAPADIERRHKVEHSRYGPIFGSTVHRALQLALEGAPGAVDDLVHVAAREHGLAEHLREALEDTERALAALRTLLGLTVRGPGPSKRMDPKASAAPEPQAKLTQLAQLAQVIHLEYPICQLLGDGRLLLGAIDLLAVRDDEVLLLDIKTDAPPASRAAVDINPIYRRQLELYAQALHAAGLLEGRRVRTGLLFTAVGDVVWL